MPTVNSMVNQNNLVASVSRKFFGLNMQAANNSLLTSAPIQTGANFLKSEFGGQPALTDMVENYNDDKNSFRQQFQEAMESLRESADKLKSSVQVEENNDDDNDENTGSTLSTLAEFNQGNIPPHERMFVESNRSTPTPENIPDENRSAAATAPPPPEDRFNNFVRDYLVSDDEEETQTLSENNQMAMVQNLVNNYNSAVSYLNENSGLSNRMSALASNFGGNALLEQSLGNIGISVDAFGNISINESVLENALKENSSAVETFLGRLAHDVDLANYQGDRLFPNILDYANDRREDETESLYAARNLNTAIHAGNQQNLLSMFT